MTITEIIISIVIIAQFIYLFIRTNKMATVIEEVQAKMVQMSTGLNNLKTKIQELQSLIAAGGTIQQVDEAAQPVLDLIDELNTLAAPPQVKPQ